MTTATDVASGKTHTAENFPVASHLIAARHRPAVLAFYHFVRAADDVADHPQLSPADKLDHLDRLEASLLGRHDGEPVAVPLRTVLAARRMSPRHPLDLLAAFRLDVTKSRTLDWADLIQYCSLSAMPVGRYVLDVHGESEATWAASDPVCAALQIVNHLQDCGQDYRNLDRVYIPDDMLRAAGVGVDALGQPQASPALQGVICGLARRARGLLDDGHGLSRMVADTRLGLEVSVIIALARRLTRLLEDRDPLCQKVHHDKFAALSIGAGAAAATLLQRLLGPSAPRRVAGTEQA